MPLAFKKFAILFPLIKTLTLINANEGVIVFCVCQQGMYGIDNEVYLSLPCVLNNGGVASVVNMTLTDDEVDQLQASANTLWDIQKDLKDI